MISTPRRGSHEESILEMLERDSGRSRGLQARSRLRWYAAGSALAVFLVGLLFWLSRESPRVQQVEAVLAAVDADRPSQPHAEDETGPADAAPALMHAPTSPAEYASITDAQQPPSRMHVTSLQHLPPIVLGKPGVLGTSAAPQPGAGAVVQDEAPATPPLPEAATAPATAPDAASQPAARPEQPAQKDDPEPARSALAPAVPEQTAAAPNATGQRPAKSINVDVPRSRAAAKASAASTRAGTRKLAHNGAKSKKASANGQAAKARVDSDVALISAVIQHSSSRAEPACADADCAAKATPQP